MWTGGILLVLACCTWAERDQAPRADTPLGSVVGSWKVSRSGRTYAAFGKVPYAEPPLGKLRFQPPTERSKWEVLYDAAQDLPTCVQPSMSHNLDPIGSEDCLYLSVHTPNISGSAPVLVHFHGGAFVVGDAQDQHPSYLIEEDIVIVQVNYRLGILGFLSFEDDTLPGNMGMKDQVQALRWVQSNIASFGGDPKRVTIIGESAGGASVYHHTISPLSKDLFHQAIAESGTSYGLWAVAPPGFAKSRAEQVLKLLNCSVSDLQDGLNCALNKTAFEIVSKFKNCLLWEMDPLTTFGPVLEKEGPNAFLTGPINGWIHKPIPLIMGMTSAEGLFRSREYIRKHQNWKQFTAIFNKVAPETFGYFSTASNPEEVTKQIRQYYLKDNEITIKDWRNLTTIYSDSLFTNAAIEGADKHTGDVYFYYFDYILKELTPELDEKLLFGACHVAESYFIWKTYIGQGDQELITRKEDIKMSQDLVQIVGDFVKFGTPTPEGRNLTWEKWTADDHKYLHINKKGFHQEKGFAEEARYQFWSTLNYRDNFSKDRTGSYASRIFTSVQLLTFTAILSILHLLTSNC